MAECYYEPTPATDGATMNPVPGAVFQVFELSDTGFTSPLSLRVGAGNPTTTVAASESLATLPGVWVTSPNFEHVWKSGAFEWRRDSIDGAKAAIQDAKVAAQLAAENAAAELSARIAAGEFQGEPGRDGSNVVPTAQAIATEISTEGTPANTALNATIVEGVEPIRKAELSISQLDRQGTSRLAIQRGRVQVRKFDAATDSELWVDLSGVTHINTVGVSNGTLIGTGASPQAAKIPATVNNGHAFVTTVIVPAGANFAGAGYAGTTAAPKASSTDAFLVGVRGDKTLGYLYGTELGGTGQASFDGSPVVAAGEMLRVTGTVEGGQVSVTVTRILTGMTYTRREGTIAASSFPGGTVGNILLYPGQAAGGTGAIGPVYWADRVTTLEQGTQHTYKTISGDNVFLAISQHHDPRIGSPLVVLLHNSGGTALNSYQDARITGFYRALLDAGYNIVSADASFSAWGNDEQLADYEAAYEWASSLVATTGVVLAGQSMGGQTAWNILPRRIIPNILAVLLVAPVASLADLWANGYSANIKTAFGVTTLEAVPDEYKPELREGYEFRGVPVMLVHSAADATCPLASTQALAAKIAPYAPEATVIESTGAHMAAQQFTDAIIHGIPFLQKYAPTA